MAPEFSFFKKQHQSMDPDLAHAPVARKPELVERCVCRMSRPRNGRWRVVEMSGVRLLLRKSVITRGDYATGSCGSQASQYCGRRLGQRAYLTRCARQIMSEMPDANSACFVSNLWMSRIASWQYWAGVSRRAARLQSMLYERFVFNLEWMPMTSRKTPRNVAGEVESGELFQPLTGKSIRRHRKPGHQT